MKLIRFFVNLFRFDRTNWKAVTLCFLAAVVFWLFNAFNKNYSTNIRFPVRFEYDHERYVPFEPLPATLLINVNGIGWDLFRKHFGLKVPELTVPLERPLEIKKIVAATLPPLLANQIGALQINYVITDTLFINMDERDEHRFKLIASDKKISYKDGLGRISPMVVLPDSVILEGPKRYLHQIPDTLVLEIPEQRISKNLRQEVEIIIPHSDMIRRNPPLAEVIFEVGEVQQVLVKVKVLLRNAPANTKLQKDSINILIEVPEARMHDFKMNETKISALLDVKGTAKGTERRLPLIQDLPSYTRVIRVDSATIRFY